MKKGKELFSLSFKESRHKKVEELNICYEKNRCNKK